MVVDMKQIGFLMLWFNRPPEDYPLLVGNPMLVPRKRWSADTGFAVQNCVESPKGAVQPPSTRNTRIAAG